MISRIVFKIFCSFALLTLCLRNASAGGNDDSTIIESDVCIIGGGSGGTYSAVRLTQSGKSVTLIEKKARLGGHVNTYIDPVTGISYDYGVQSFHNISVVTNYFESLGVALGSFSNPAGNQQDANFATGEPVNASVLYPLEATGAAFFAYNEILSNYSYLVNGFHLPSPVPEDLLITWAEFIQKYQLEALAYTSFWINEGVGNILAQPALYILKYLSQGVVEGILANNFVTTAAHNNQALYDKALSVLGSSVLLSSKVTSIIRYDDYVEVTVSTPSGTKIIKASKLLIAIQPKLHSLGFLDLTSQEKYLFGQFNNSYYWDSLIRNPGIPANLSMSNVDPAAPLLIPATPGIYVIDKTTVPDVYAVYYTSPYPLSEEYVKEDILATVARVVKGAGFPPVGGSPEIVGFHDHRPFELTVSTDLIKNGFYDQLNALQGKRRTWYTGATWQAHDSSLIWNFTEYNVLPGLLA